MFYCSVFNWTIAVIGRCGVIFVSRRFAWPLPFVLLFLAGCWGDSTPVKPPETLPFTGQQIRLGVPADKGFRTAWEAPLNEWAAQSGAKYTLTEFPPAARAEDFTWLSGADRQTLAIFPLEQAGPLIAAGELAVIPPALVGNDDDGVDWRDLFGGLAEKLAARKGEPLFVPLSCPVLVCYYRHDLLTAAGLNPPQTWDDYQQLLEKLESWAAGLTALEPWSEDFRATMFLARSLAFAQHPSHFSLFFDIETGDPLINSPGFVRGLKVARASIEKMPEAVLTYGPADCRDAILRGRAALALAFETAGDGALPSSDPSASGAADRPGGMTIGFARLPGSRETYNPTRRAWEPPADKGTHQVTLCGFAGLAIAASSRNSPVETAAAWNALAKVRGQTFASGFPAGIVGLCRESQLQNPAGAVGGDLDGDEAAACAAAIAQSLRDARLVAELPVPGRAEFLTALAKAVTPALAGTQSPEEALTEAADAWRMILDKLGKEQIRDAYRVNIGLSPLARK